MHRGRRSRRQDSSEDESSDSPSVIVEDSTAEDNTAAWDEFFRGEADAARREEEAQKSGADDGDRIGLKLRAFRRRVRRFFDDQAGAADADAEEDAYISM